MIIIAILLLGALAPFLIIYGWLVFFLAMPFLAALNWAWPYWLRIPLEQRRRIIRRGLWACSIATYGALLVFAR